MANSDLVFRLFGVDVSAGTALDRVRFRAVETGGALRTLGTYGAIAFAAIGVAAVSASVKGIEMAVDFQRQMMLLNTQAGVSKNKIAGLSDGVLQLAGQVGFSPQSLAEALYFVESNFESLGKKAPDAMGVLKYAAMGAKIGMANLTDTTTSLTATLAAFANKGVTAKSAMATLNAIVGTGEMTFQQLNEAIKTGVMATMQQYGVRLNEVGAALATFGDNNLRGAQAGTSLRMAVQALAKPVMTAKTRLKELHLTVTSMRDAMARKGLTGALELFMSHAVDAGYKLDGFKKIMKDTASSMKHGGITEGIKTFAKETGASGSKVKNLGGLIMDVFGKRAGTGIALLLQEFDRYKSKIPQITAATKKFDQAWKDTSETVAVKWDKLKAKWDVFLIHLGNSLLPWVTNTVIPTLDKIVTWFDTNLPGIEDKFTTFTGNVAAGWGDVKSAWQDFRDAFSDNVWLGSTAAGIGAVAAALTAVKVAAAGMGAASLIYNTAVFGMAGATTLLSDALMLLWANPIGLVILGILAIAAALTYAYFHSQTFRNIVDDIAGSIKNVTVWINDHWIPAVVNFVATLKKNGPAAVATFKTISDSMDVVSGRFKKLGDDEKTWAGNTVTWLMRAEIGFEHLTTKAFSWSVTMKRVLDAVKRDVGGMVSNVLTVLRSSWSLISQLMPAPFRGAIQTIHVLWSGLSGWMSGWAGMVAGKVRGIWAPLVAGFRTAIAGIQAAWNVLSFHPPSMPGPTDGGTGGLIGGIIRNFIPHFASGGVITSPTVGLIGESGPEAIIPLSQLRGGGGGTVNVYVSTLATDDRDLVKKIRTAFTRVGAAGLPAAI
jgi:TP901 family phage tail tape measure protein